jgi:hypothetical protein
MINYYKVFSPRVHFLITGDAFVVVEGPHHRQVILQHLRRLSLVAASDAEDADGVHVFLEQQVEMYCKFPHPLCAPKFES